MGRTLMDVFDSVAGLYPQRPAMRIKRDGRWRVTTWAVYRELARRVARAFIALGLEPGQGVAILAFNRPEWFVSDVAAIMAGGIPAGIYTSCSPEQCQYITDHCEAPIIVVENAEQLAKIREVQDDLPLLQHIVLMDGSDPAQDVITWDQLLRKGDEVSERELQARIDAQAADDLCTLIYTSGTTGPPKAVMLSHHNITWTCKALVELIKEHKYGPEDSVVSYLPLSHIAEQVVSLHLPMHYGGSAWFVESIPTLGDTLKEAHPSMFLAVPRVWEKMQAKITAAASQNSDFKRKVGAWARDIGLAGGYAVQQGRSKPLLWPVADALVFSKVRKALGFERCRLFVTSTAPTSLDTLEFFLSLGIPLCEIYGMSECTGPATISIPEKYRTGKAGFAIPGTGIKIAADGEVLLSGPHVFQGYYKDEAATREALAEDGWLRSGDIGTIDDEGFLKITDRKKEIIVTAGGKNIAPQLVESLLKSIRAVGQAVVIGDRRKFISALISLDPETIAEEAERAGIEGRSIADAASSATFREYLQRQIDGVNKRLSRVESVKKFVILPKELTPEGGELTPTMKLKRRVIHELYADQIESMYVD